MNSELIEFVEKVPAELADNVFALSAAFCAYKICKDAASADLGIEWTECSADDGEIVCLYAGDERAFGKLFNEALDDLSAGLPLRAVIDDLMTHVETKGDEVLERRRDEACRRYIDACEKCFGHEK